MEIDFGWLEKAVCNRPLTKTERQALADVIEVILMPPGMPIMHQGEAGSTLYILRSGSTDISCRSGNKETLLSRDDKSRVFGEISMFSNEPTCAKVVASLPCTVYKITRENFEMIMHKHQKLALSMLAFIVRNMGEVIRRLDMKQTTMSGRKL